MRVNLACMHGRLHCTAFALRVGNNSPRCLRQCMRGRTQWAPVAMLLPQPAPVASRGHVLVHQVLALALLLLLVDNLLPLIVAGHLLQLVKQVHVIALLLRNGARGARHGALARSGVLGMLAGGGMRAHHVGAELWI